MMLPTTLGLILPAFPVEQRAAGDRHLVGGRRRRRRARPADRRPAGRSSAGAGSSSSTSRSGSSPRSSRCAPCDEVREPEDGRPDLLGAAELALGIGLLTLGIVKGAGLGLGRRRARSAPSLAAVGLVVAFLRRSAHHHAPVIELPLLRVRSFALANLAAAVFFAGFGAMLLSGVLLLTEVWGYSALTAGLALSPGPLMAATFAIPSGPPRRPHRPAPGRRRRRPRLRRRLRLHPRHGRPDPRIRDAPSCPASCSAAPASGMTLGTLPAAATASLPPERFATGTAVFGMARQLGSAIGVAVLVALLDGSRRRPARRPAARLGLRPRHRPRRRRPWRWPSARSAGPAPRAIDRPAPEPALERAARLRLGRLERAAAAQPHALVFGDLRAAGRPRSSPGRRGGGASRSAPPSSGGRRRSRSAPRPRASGSASSRRSSAAAARVEVADEQQHADHEGDDPQGPQDEQHPVRIRFRPMPEAYVVDALRTPMGAYRGALSGVRPDDLAAHTIARRGRAQRRRPRADRRRLLRRRQPVRRGQPRRRPDGGAAGRPARTASPAPPSTASAPPAWRRSTAPPARSRPARATSTWPAASSR